MSTNVGRTISAVRTASLMAVGMILGLGTLWLVQYLLLHGPRTH